MKRTLLILAILCAFFNVDAQIYQAIPGFGFKWQRVSPDSVLHIPSSSDTTLRTSYTTLPQTRRIGDSLWFYNGARWSNVSRGSIDSASLLNKTVRTFGAQSVSGTKTFLDSALFNKSFAAYNNMAIFGTGNAVIKIGYGATVDEAQIKIGDSFIFKRVGTADPYIASVAKNLLVYTNGLQVYGDSASGTFAPGKIRLAGNYGFGVAHFGAFNTSTANLYFGNATTTANTYTQEMTIYGRNNRWMINDTSTIPTYQLSSIFTLQSTKKGFLLPRMTTAQRDAIATPATGLEVYNTTTNTKNYYNGSAWVSLLNETSAASTYMPKSGGDFTGTVTGTTLSMTNNITANTFIKATGTADQIMIADGTTLDKTNIHTGAPTFDTTGRTLTIPTVGGGSYSVVIPRGTSSGAEGITALSNSRAGNLVTVAGDNGSTTVFSIRDADSALLMKYTDTAAMLSNYYRTSTATGALALKLNISDTAAMLSPFVQYSDTTTLLSKTVRTFGSQSISGFKTLNDSSYFKSVTKYDSTAKFYKRIIVSPTGNSYYQDFGIGEDGPAVFVNQLFDGGNTSNEHGFIDATTFKNRTNKAYNSYDAQATMSGTVNLDHHAAFQSRPNIVLTGGATISNLWSYLSAPNVSSGNITNLYHFQNFPTIGSANVSNEYGLYIKQLRGTRAYGIYVEVDSVFVGNQVEATKFKVTSATSSQFLKGDGSLDNNSYATTGALAAKLNIGDTASMLAPFMQYSDTASMLAPFMQYSDTASMLSPYARTSNLPDFSSKLNVSDTAAMLSPYRRTTTKITNSDLVNSSITINSTPVSLGGSISVGSVTSVGLSVPTGFSVSGSPVTSSGTLALSFASGYSLPTDANQALWTTAYNKRITSASANSTTLTLTLGDASTVTTSFPTFNQNTTGTARTITEVLSKTLGGAGDVTGVMYANGAGTVRAATAADIPSLNAYYLPLGGGALSGPVSSNSSITLDNGVFFRAKRNTSASALNVLGFESGTDDLIQVTSNSWKLRNTGTGDAANILKVDADALVTMYGALSGTSASFSSSIVATSYQNTAQLAMLLNNSTANNDFRFGSSGGVFRIVNSTNTSGVFTVNNSGATYSLSTITAEGDIRSNAIYRDYQGEALIQTSGSENQIGSAGAGTPRSVKIFAGNATALTINTSQAATFSSNAIATGGFEIPNGQFYRARRSSGSLLINLLGIESGSDRTIMTTTGDYVLQNGSNVPLQTTTTTGATTFGSTVTATGFFESSDARLKNVIKRDGDVAYFKWKDGQDNKVHIGYIAQEVQKSNPNQVKADDKGFLSVNYTEILVEKVRSLEKRISELENRNK